MSTDPSKPRPDADDILVPPPFGVADTSGDQLLPIATSMSLLADGDEADDVVPDPSDESGDADLQPNTIESEPQPSATAPTTTPSAAIEEPRTVGRAGSFLLVLCVVALGVGGYLVLGPQTPESSDDMSSRGSTDEAAAPRPAMPDPAAGSAAASNVDPLPTSLDELRKLPFAERHAALQNAMTDSVAIEDHVGLDLLQASQSETPCRTFSDALATIRSSEDPSVYSWALEEAAVPTNDECPDGLPARLDELRGTAGLGDDTPSQATRVRSPSKRPTKSRPEARPPDPTPRDQPPEPTAPQQALPEEPAPVEPASKPKPSIATKLDDDLKGLGE